MFFELLIGMIPLFVLMVCGWVLGKQGNVTPHAMADILIHIISPFVTFGAIAQLEFSQEYILLPFITAIIAGIASFTAWRISDYFFKDTTPNLIGLSCVAGNITYFALPILMMLLPVKWVGVYFMMRMGLQLTEMTQGYYIGARGNFNITQSLYKIITFPPLYGAILGLLWNVSDMELPKLVVTYWNYALGAVVFIGMMLIGTALSLIKSFYIDKKMLIILMVMRFMVWPVLCISFIILDKMVLHIFSNDIYIMFTLLGLVPLPVNSIAYAIKLKLDATAMSICVLISTVFALIYVPVMLWILEYIGFIHI